ncbi:tautomerase family protein [Granulicella arctica]|uniref:tautomerase family protein n=1 Tax=Granulicella arctica TaxID=940613 RepID=UPI0021DF5C1F|nr:tautomerase family protein [Granulicella arctica]
MPLVRIDVIEGRREEEVQALLEAAHRAVVLALGVPERDRYQIYKAHAKGHLVVQDTGLNIDRTDDVVIFTIFSKKRDEALKVKLYRALTEHLATSCGIAPSDVVICLIENGDADWSFGNGSAQFLTGDLP